MNVLHLLVPAICLLALYSMFIAYQHVLEEATLLHEQALLMALQSHEQEEQHRVPSRILLATLLFSQQQASRQFLRLFLKAAESSGVDIVIVGDARPLFPFPANVRHHYISWNDFVGLAERQMHFDATALRMSNTYYKVNDFKPAFGYLFPSLTRGYDWWGTIDNDVLLGSVDLIVGPYLNDYDVIGGIETHPTWGPFTMYRNTDHINTLFQKALVSPQEIFGVPYGVIFDEWPEFGALKDVPGASMSEIIELNHDSVRSQRGANTSLSPVVDGPWGECGPDTHRPNPRCNECLYRAQQEPLQRLLYRDSATGVYRATLLCHYQFSKHRLEEQMLSNPTMVDKLLEIGEFRVNAPDGLQPILAD